MKEETVSLEGALDLGIHPLALGDLIFRGVITPLDGGRRFRTMDIINHLND